MASIDWHVEGMTCGGCSKRLTGILEKAAGVSDLVVSHEENFVRLTLDEAKTSQAALREMIEDAGFDVV